jgi:hypothetical protein
MSEVTPKSKNQRDIIIKVLRTKFHEALKDKKNSEEKEFAVAMIGFDVNLYTLRREVEKNKKLKNDGKTFRPIDLEPIKDDMLPNVVLQHQFDNLKGTLNFKSQSGMFKIAFSDGSNLFFAQRLVGLGKTEFVDSYAVASKQTLNKYYQYLNKQAKINSKPKIGLYKIHTVNTPFGEKLNYELIKPKDYKTNIVFHQNKGLLKDDVQQFFDNISYYTRFSQPGSRRLLLVGEPGGGKTSAAMLLAQEYAKAMCVVIATDLKSAMMHTYNISKAKMPTLIILEDAESTLPWGSAGVLNFLDGVNQPKTEKGCYMILTTNFPQRIEPRILKRPGRIDKVIKFGALNEENSVLCMKHYFDGILFDSKKDSKKKVEEILKQVYEEIILDKENGGTMTGAQIKNLSETIMAYAVSNKVETITVDTLKKVVEALNRDLKEVYDMADEESISRDRMTPIGFEQTGLKKSYGNDLDWDSIMNPKTTKNKETW